MTLNIEKARKSMITGLSVDMFPVCLRAEKYFNKQACTGGVRQHCLEMTGL